jgi:hypothetical protein
MLTMAGGTTQQVSPQSLTSRQAHLVRGLVGNDQVPIMPMTMSSVTLTVLGGA